MSAPRRIFLFLGRDSRPVFLFQNETGGRCMQLTLIKNPDESKSDVYKIARVVYAETHATSLRAVESLTSMIANIARTSGRSYADIVSDTELFPALNPASSSHHLLATDANERGLQMCVRVAMRMMRGALPDTCNGATCFHHSDVIPPWATSRGYIADIDGLLFYL